MMNKKLFLPVSILTISLLLLTACNLGLATQPLGAVESPAGEPIADPLPTPTVMPTNAPTPEPTPTVAVEAAVTPTPTPTATPEPTTPPVSTTSGEQVVSPTPTPVPVASGATPIRFEPGRTFGHVQGQLNGFETDVYSFVAREGQLALAVVEGNAGNLSVEIAPPQGTLFGAQFNFWRGILPSNGDYLLKVESDVADASYTVTLYIEDFATERVSFAPGADSAQLSGGLADTSLAAYSLRARAGQVLSLNLTASSHAVNIASVYQLFPSGELFEVALINRRSYLGTLPADGDYIVVVAAGVSGGEYALDVAITE